jgi:hypothetical protein
MFVKKIIGGVVVLACALAASAMDDSMEYFRDSKRQYQPFRFKIEQGHDEIVFKDASGSFLVEKFKSLLKESEEKIISLEEQNGQNVKGLTEELGRLPEGPKRFSFEQYLSVLKEEREELERRRNAIGTYEPLFFRTLDAIYRSQAKEVFCFVVPNFHVLNNQKLQGIPLNSLLVMTGSCGVEVRGESYVKLEIKGLPSDLCDRLTSFFQREVKLRAIELHDLKKKWTKKSKALYEIHKTYSAFNPLFISETKRLEPQIKKLIDDAQDIIEQLELAWRMTEAIRIFQKEVLEHVKRGFQKGALESLERDYPPSFSRKREEDNGHDKHSLEEEKPTEEKGEKKEETEDDSSPEIFVKDDTQEPSKGRVLLEGGTRLLEESVSRLTKSRWLPPPDQRTWGDVASFYSPFKASQQQDDQTKSEPEKKQDDVSRTTMTNGEN